MRRLQNFNKPGAKENCILNITNTDDETDFEIFFNKEVTDSPRFDTAKREELQKWKNMNAYEEVPNTGQSCITSRFVCTEKLKGDKLILKARLVLRGFEENTTQIKTDSPTCNKETVRLLLSVLAGNKWSLHSLDIKSAFLQSDKIERDTYVKPPKFAKTDQIWKLKTTAYGLADASRQWYIKVLKELTILGAIQSQLDKAMFLWHHNENVIGTMIIHVDDFLYGGSMQFKSEILPLIRSKFLVGLEESINFRYLGLSMSEKQNHNMVNIIFLYYRNVYKRIFL